MLNRIKNSAPKFKSLQKYFQLSNLLNIAGFTGILVGFISSIYLSGWSGGSTFYRTTIFSVLIFILTQIYYRVINYQIQRLNRIEFALLRFLPFISIIILESLIKKDINWIVGILVFFSIINLGWICAELISPASKNHMLASLPLGQLLVTTIFLIFNTILPQKFTTILIFTITLTNVIILIFRQKSFLKFEKKLRKIDGFNNFNLVNATLNMPSVNLGILFVFLLTSFTPVLGYDSLSMKLWLPIQWAKQDSIFLPTEHILSGVTGSFSFPILMGASIGFETIGNSLQFLSLLFVSLVVMHFLTISKNFNRQSSPFISVLLLAIPSYAWQIGNSYDDLWLMAIFSLGILFLNSNTANLSRKNMILVTITLAAISSSKFSLFPVTFIIFIVYLCSSIVFIKSIAKWLTFFICMIIFVLGISPYYGWKWINYGNPVWPTFNALFKAPSLPFTNIKFNFPYLKFDWSDIFMSPISTLIQPNKWGEEGAPGTYAAILSIILISAIATLKFLRTKELYWPGIVTIFFVFFWFINFRYSRYLIPVFPLALLTVQNLLSKYEQKNLLNLFWKKRQSFALGCMIVAAITIGNPVFPDRIPYGNLFSSQTNSEFLNQKNTEYRLTKFLNSFLPKNAEVVSPTLYQRLWLRPDIDLFHTWEISNQRAQTMWLVLPTELFKFSKSESIDCRPRSEFEGWVIIKPNCEIR